jgi:hypothetical protein
VSLLNRAQYPSDLIALVLLWRLHYKLSLRDLPEMFLIRGIAFSREANRDWEAKLTPALAESLRRRGKAEPGAGVSVSPRHHLRSFSTPASPHDGGCLSTGPGQSVPDLATGDLCPAGRLIWARGLQLN